jgi:hypothetical protein
MAKGNKVHHPPWPFFSWIESFEIKTRGREDYEAVVADPERYADLKTLMEKFFVNPIEMFPDSAPVGQEGRIRKPREYFEIQLELIDERFPGARGQFGDADIRELISEFRSVFWRNIVKFVISKKLILLVTGLLPIFACVWAGMLPVLCADKSGQGFCMAMPRSNTEAALAVLVVIALSLGAFHFLNSQLFGEYREKLHRSAANVSHGTVQRTKQLAKLFGELHFNIEDGQNVLKDRRQWPDDAGRWTVMAYWISQRLDYLERFIQIEMWRIRRGHYWVNRGGYVLTWVTGALLACGVVGVAVWLLIAGQIDKTWPVFLELAMAAAAAAYMTVQSYVRADWRTPLSFVAEQLHPGDWERYSGLKLHEELYKQARTDKLQRNDLDAKLQR